jgi:hypothetical protein
MQVVPMLVAGPDGQPQVVYVMQPVQPSPMPVQPARPQPMSMQPLPASLPGLAASSAGPYGFPSGYDDGPKQLIVNFLDPEVTNAELHTAFSAVGPLDAARVIYDKFTSKSKGFGFVYYKSSRDAATAMQCMSGHPLRGRRVKVSYANPQRPIVPSDGVM